MQEGGGGGGGWGAESVGTGHDSYWNSPGVLKYACKDVLLVP